MQRQMLLSAAVVLFSASGALAQAAASSTSNPLNEFIGAANSAVGIISSANAQQTSTSSSSSSSAIPTSSTQPASAASPLAAASPAHHSNSHRNLIIIIVCCVVGALIIAAILAAICCCLARRRRRHRKQTAGPIEKDEKTDFRSSASPFNPGRNYAPLNPQNHTPSMEQQPIVPMLAASTTPGTYQHAAQHPQNPFIPVPPSPRKGINSGNDSGPFESHISPTYTTTTTTITKPYPETQPLRRSSQSPSTLPTHPTADRPSTPFGLSGIGRPYDDMHVHVLQTDNPSRELRNSLNNRSPIQHYSTPPLVPSRSPHRHSGSLTLADSSYHSISEGSSSGSGSGEEWRRSQQALYPDHQRQKHYSDIAAANVLPAPPVPWDNHARRSSSSPRTSIGTGTPPSPRPQERRASRSPATPRRLRFSDVQRSGNGNGEGAWDQRRGSGAVGEAL